MEVYAGIKYTKKHEAWGYDVIIYLGAYVSVVTGITISGFVEWIKDNKEYTDGVYLNPKLTFHGLTMTVTAKGSGKLEKNGKELALLSTEAGGEIVIMDSFEATLDFKIPLIN